MKSQQYKEKFLVLCSYELVSNGQDTWIQNLLSLLHIDTGQHALPVCDLVFFPIIYVYHDNMSYSSLTMMLIKVHKVLRIRHIIRTT